MDRSIYIAMDGASQIMLAQAVNSNNLANADTPGFRADLISMINLPVYGPGEASRVYPEIQDYGVDFGQGTITPTGRELDIAIDGDGWIAVQAPDGSEAYTRAGNLQITSTGLLVTGGGLPVLGNGGPIAIPPYEKLDIAADGTITALPLGQDPNALAVVDRIKLVNPPRDQLRKGEDGLLHLPEGESAPPDAAVKLIAGALESSNVNTVEAMVRMIELARAFEMQVKVMQTVGDNAQLSNQLLSFSS